MFNSALVPVDGSALALEALPVAKQAVGSRGTVVLVAVIEPTGAHLARTARAGAAGRSARVAIELAEHAAHGDRQEAEADLEAARAAGRSLGLRVRAAVVREGQPGEAILAEAKRAACDLVVISTSSKSGVKRAVIGSVADHVIRNASGIPVIVIRPTGRRRR
jgi:nucleotide-binding universal stress UspA family protein